MSLGLQPHTRRLSWEGSLFLAAVRLHAPWGTLKLPLEGGPLGWAVAGVRTMTWGAPTTITIARRRLYEEERRRKKKEKQL